MIIARKVYNIKVHVFTSIHNTNCVKYHLYFI